MQIIQGIREKGAAIVITVIALSLVGFILMDAKSGSNNMANSRSTTVGKVNGSAIQKDEYEKRVQLQQQQQEQQQQGMKMSTAQINQLRGQVWDQMVAEKIFFAEADKLGIDFTNKELAAILYSADPSNPILREVADPATGKPDEAKVRDVINTIKKPKTAEQRDMIESQLLDPQALTSISQKYMGLLNASAYYPSWMEEKDVKEAKTFANISYVAVPYTVINDSAVKVTDEDIEKYVQQHKAQFKQEAGRMISYISFSQLPNQADSARTKEAVEALRNDFAAQTESNIKSFIARNSSIPYDTNYVTKANVRSRAVDTILRLPVGTVYGPYVDNGSLVLAKVMGIKSFPDSVKARHILIATTDMQSHQQILDDSTAKKRADSINTAIGNGASFAALAAQYSADGSKDKGGDLGTFGYGQMVPEFNEYCFTKPVGSRGVVKTMFGYHIIEVESQKGSSPAYKIAYTAKEIIASPETINAASNESLKAAAIKDAKKLDEYAQKNGLRKTDVPTLVKENDYQVGQLQDAQQLVKWVFDAKKGDVSEPYNINDQFVVAIVDKIYEKGLQDVATARPLAENAVREEKKSAEILKKLGSSPTLESAAAAYPNGQVLTAGADSSVTFTARIINGIGAEPKVIGAAFNKDNQSKVSAPIIGKTGVFLLKVNSTGTKAADTPEAAAAFRNQQIATNRSQAAGNWFQSLKDQANIKDKRSE